jgi:hypothetical protein
LIFNPHREPAVFLFHERGRDQEIRRCTIARDRNVVNHGYTKKRLDVYVVRMRLERIREKDDEIDSSLDDRGADLLIATERSAGEASDIETKLRSEDRARRAGCEEIVVQKNASVAANPVEEIVLAVIVSDQSDVLSGVHQK